MRCGAVAVLLVHRIDFRTCTLAKPTEVRIECSRERHEDARHSCSLPLEAGPDWGKTVCWQTDNLNDVLVEGRIL